jgi:hypothetical protein
VHIKYTCGVDEGAVWINHLQQINHDQNIRPEME